MSDSDQPTGAVTLDYAQPPEHLRAYLSVFYEFRADVALFEDTDRADLAQFRIMLSGEGDYTFADGHHQRGPQIQIVGPTTGPVKMRVRGPVHTVGVGLLPAGWGSLLDFEASMLVNRVIDAVELFGDDVRGAPEAIAACPTLEDKVKLGSALADKLIGRGKTAAFDFTRMVDDWLESSLSPDIDDLCAATRLSRRQVERRCNAYYGAPPKLLSRKYRALRASIALAKGEMSADDLLAQGFYDQSHFIREIKAFTGVTPSQLGDELPGLAGLTLKRTSMTLI
jgi:AraC-like DNA-binding protein